jgi:rRNA biogenesis protein RRP5
MKCDDQSNRVDVSLRASRIQGDLDEDPEPQVGDILQGFVITTNKNGCFVRLSNSVEGRSTLKEICDGFLPHPETTFPTGRLVVGKVKATRPIPKRGKGNHDSTTLQVDLDMRESTLMQDSENRVTFQDVQVGEKYKGFVQRVEAYGVFVQIENSDVSGLTHISECSEKFVKNLNTLFHPGDPVKVLVLKKDDEGQKIGFSMKASHFEDDEDSDASSIDSEMINVEDDDDKDAEMSDVREPQDDSDEESENDLDSDDENFASKLAAKMSQGKANRNDSSSSEEGSDSDDSEESGDEDGDDSSEDEEDRSNTLDTDVGFSWGASAFEKAKLKAVSQSQDSDSSDSSDSDSESEDDVRNESSKSHKSRKRQAERRREERETSRRELALADGTADENPETAGDFERLLAGDPNSSELWIRYMAFHLSLADIPSARRIADKAFERIEMRKEREKLNVWSALLKLEHKYGSEETFQAAIDRACQQNNSKQVYLRACEILENEVDESNHERNTVSRADQLFSTMCKKHKSKKKVWLAHMQYLLRQSRHQEAHALMKRAMLSLAPYKHAETMSKFAQMEFELGSSERGRTLFDGLLVKYPKRLDLFFVYLDKEVKYGKIEHARSMLEQKVQARKLSDKQMKSLFKKWYKMEEEHGTEETQEHVKESARNYVSSSASGN